MWATRTSRQLVVEGVVVANEPFQANAIPHHVVQVTRGGRRFGAVVRGDGTAPRDPAVPGNSGPARSHNRHGNAGPGLRRRAPRGPPQRCLGAERRPVDDPSAAVSRHRRRRRPGHSHRPEEVGLKDRSRLIVAGLLPRPEQGVTVSALSQLQRCRDGELGTGAHVRTGRRRAVLGGTTPRLPGAVADVSVPLAVLFCPDACCWALGGDGWEGAGGEAPRSKVG